MLVRIALTRLGAISMATVQLHGITQTQARVGKEERSMHQRLNLVLNHITPAMLLQNATGNSAFTWLRCRHKAQHVAIM